MLCINYLCYTYFLCYSYASDSQIKVAVRGLTAGIKDLTVSIDTSVVYNK